MFSKSTFSKNYHCQRCSEQFSSLEHYHEDLNLCDHCVQETISELKLEILHLKAENKDLSQRCKRLNIDAEETVALEEFKVKQDELWEQLKINDESWVRIPEGQFNGRFMPSFEMLKTPVTFEMYDLFCLNTKLKQPFDEGWGRANRPVIHVDYYQVQAYIEWLNQQSHWCCSLPTEEQWEYACRAGTISQYWYGDHPDRRMMVVDTNQTKPTPGKHLANPWGLYDMHGNVWEWTCSKNGSKYILCGGSWYNCDNWLTSRARNISFASGSYNNWGFRLIREP